jgi:hypothetical protein
MLQEYGKEYQDRLNRLQGWINRLTLFAIPAAFLGVIYSFAVFGYPTGSQTTLIVAVASLVASLFCFIAIDILLNRKNNEIEKRQDFLVERLAGSSQPKKQHRSE